jgi:peroxiredoxin
MLGVRPAMEGNLVAGFDLPRAGGGRVRLRSYRGRRSLAVWFMHNADCELCRVTAAAIVPRYGDYAYADAEPLLIVPGPAPAVEALRRELALPYPVLSDEDGSVGRRYGAPGAALLIADRFGAPAVWHVAGAGHDLPDQDAVLQELEYLSHTCSGGCATPIWPNAGE